LPCKSFKGSNILIAILLFIPFLSIPIKKGSLSEALSKLDVLERDTSLRLQVC
jgi:hypothetical protein